MNGLRVPQEHQHIQPKCIHRGPNSVPRSVIVRFGLTLVVTCYVEAFFIYLFFFKEDRAVDWGGARRMWTERESAVWM